MSDPKHISEVLAEVLRPIHKKLDDQAQEIAFLRKELSGRNLAGNWVSQQVAEDMLGIGYHQLRNIRRHEENGSIVGHIRCRKSTKGRSWEYHKADIEKYKSHVTI